MFLETRASDAVQITSGADVMQKVKLTRTEGPSGTMYYYFGYVFKPTSSTVTLHSSIMIYLYAKLD